jgi:SAM-dependent methyltransferase
MNHDMTSQAFFDSMYRANSDPWSFASSEYEGLRYQTLLQALGDDRFHHAFEPGCSVGVLTEQLSARCDRVDAIDISPTAVELARKRCSSLANVSIRCGSLLHPMIEGGCDLVVFSEIGYYFEEETLREILSKLVASMKQQGTLLAVHWLGSSPDHLLSGDRVHEIIDEIDELIHDKAERHSGFRLDRWRRQ